MSICSFCDAPTNSKEDAWPVWLAKRFGGKQSTIDAEIGGRAFQWRTSQPRLAVHCVCSDCNNGWMSDLEGDTIPIVDRLLGSERTGLSLVQQATLARWSVKTAMVLEAVDRVRTPFYSIAERKSLRALSVLPSRSSVWIAKCVQPPGVFTVGKDLGTAVGKGVRGFATTMAFGTIAIQVLTIRVPDTVPESTSTTIETREGPWEEVSLWVWPAAADAIAWPAGVGLAGLEGLNALAERFSPVPHGNAA